MMGMPVPLQLKSPNRVTSSVARTVEDAVESRTIGPLSGRDGRSQSGTFVVVSGRLLDLP